MWVGPMDPLFFIGLLLVIIGVILIVISSIKMIKVEGSKCESSGVILIGPIPIVWGTSKKLTAIMGVVTAIIILVIALLWVASLTGG